MQEQFHAIGEPSDTGFSPQAFRVYLAREVRRAVRSSGRTLGQVSADVGMSASTLSRAVNARRPLYVAELFAIASVTCSAIDVARWVDVANRKARHGVVAEVIER